MVRPGSPGEVVHTEGNPLEHRAVGSQTRNSGAGHAGAFGLPARHEAPLVLSDLRETT